MTTYFAQNSNVNIDTGNLWNTISDGSGDYLSWPPQVNDILDSNGQANLTINIVTAIAELKGGNFLVANDIILYNGIANDIISLTNTINLLANTVNQIYDKIVFQVPNGPVVTIPPPACSNTTIAWSYCYDGNGLPVSGMKFYIKLSEVLNTNITGAYSADEITFESNNEGVAFTEIPRGSNFRFRVKSGKASQWIEFSGTNSEYLELPFLISR